MARIFKPLFRSRHHRKQPKWNLGDPPKTKPRRPEQSLPEPVWNLGDPPRNWWQRVDWLLLSLVVIAFVASFVWLF